MANHFLDFRYRGHPVVTRESLFLPPRKLTKRVVDQAEPISARYSIWDAQISGFGVRITSSGVKTFFLRYRPKNRPTLKRYITLGRYGVVTVEQAREHAKRLLGVVANGDDPAHQARETRDAPSVANAAAIFLVDHVASKRKPKTLVSYSHALEHHIIPKIGNKSLLELKRADVSRLHLSLVSTPFMANYVVTVLSSLYGWADQQDLVPDGYNPARRIEKFRERRRERFLSQAEFARLGAALREAESIGIPYEIDESRPTAKHAPKLENRRVVVAPDAVAAIRLLTLTGCRLREVLNLRWREIDFERGLLLLPDSKTGQKSVVLGAAAMAILAQLPQVGAYVFPGASCDKHRGDLKRPWSLIRRRAGLEDLRLHDLRHSYASVGVGAGLGLPIIAKLLGHSQPSSTARYAHLADDPLRLASERIAESIAAAMR